MTADVTGPVSHTGTQGGEPLLLVERRDRVLWLRLNRPRAANALNASLHQALVAALAAADLDPEVGAVVLCAAGGRVFSAGADLKEFSERPPLEARRIRRALLRDTVLALCDFGKPLLACVEGKAIGAGGMLALLSDQVHLAEQATLSMPEIELGSASPLAISIVVARAGRTVAQRMVQQGEPIAAPLALALGLADQWHAMADLEDQVRVAAQRLSVLNARAYRQNRRWMYWRLRREILVATGDFSDWIDQDNEGASGDGA
jgi:enoyl-CoA hydratase/carnithine racemase